MKKLTAFLAFLLYTMSINDIHSQQIEVLNYKDGAIFGIPFNYSGYLYCDDINSCLKGNNEFVYNNNQKIEAISEFNGGHITSFSDGGIYIKDHDLELGSGIKVRTAGQSVKFFTPFKNGIVTVFEQGGVYWSPNGYNLGGPKPTQKLYSGSQKVTAMINYKGGLITAFDGGGAYFSFDGKNIAGGRWDV